MAHAAGPQQHRVEEVVVRRVAGAERLARVQEERQLDALGGALRPEPEELGQEVGVGAPEILGPDEVVAGDEVWEGELGGDAVVHVFEDGARVGAAAAGPDHFFWPEARLVRFLCEEEREPGTRGDRIVVAGRHLLRSPQNEAPLGVALNFLISSSITVNACI